MLTGKQKPNLNFDTLRVFLTKSISLFNALTRCISQKKKIVPRSSFLNRHERQCVGQFHPQSRPHTCQEKYYRMKECMGLNIIFLADVGVTQSSAHLQQICGVTFYVILYKKTHTSLSMTSPTDRPVHFGNHSGISENLAEVSVVCVAHYIPCSF